MSLCEGFLGKRSDTLKVFNKRYFRLVRGRGIAWWDYQYSYRILGEVFITPDMQITHTGKLELMVSPPNESSPILVLRAPNEEERDKWVKELTSYQKELITPTVTHETKEEALPDAGSAAAANHPRWKEMQPDWHNGTALREGNDFDTLELAEDVYVTAYLLAKNATDTMYSFAPWKNRQVWLVWFYLIFIVFSQTFAIYAIVWKYPPVVSNGIHFVDCENSTSPTYEELLNRHVFETQQECLEVGDVAFDTEIQGRSVQYRRVETETLYYENIFSFQNWGTTLLQIVSCAWVVTQVYFRDFTNVTKLFQYRDFNIWFLPHKGETTSRKQDLFLLIPFIQWALSTAIVCVSCVVICGFDEAFDIVMNSLAFTFIAEVAEVFNQPLTNHYGKLPIAGLDPELYGTDPIMYMVSEYSAANASETGWYVLEDEDKAGMITDFRIRHDPSVYSHPTDKVVKLLRFLFFFLPVLCLVWGYFHTHPLSANQATLSHGEL